MAKEKFDFHEDEDTTTLLEFPPDYKIIFHNDDFTTMEFVVEVLISIFHKTKIQAERLMMKIHKGGSAIVGVYCYDIAQTKKNATIQLARSKGFPLRVTIEKDN
ncbi:MAG: ATP-dependent Clp protease adaptor ClpS [Treponemataceae bacterium]|nr:ATP-dependent Clp protease adaptor ClpS [Treponemataceae bacterium]